MWSEDTSLFEDIDQESGRGAFEPVGAELTVLEEQQNVEGIVDGSDLAVSSAIAVIPLSDCLKIQARQLKSKYRVYILISVAADRGVLGQQRDIA